MYGNQERLYFNFLFQYIGYFSIPKEVLFLCSLFEKLNQNWVDYQQWELNNKT